MAGYIRKSIIDRRCDEAMRRSKEKCYTQYWERWKCTGECKECICCIVKDDHGGEKHISFGG